MFAYLSCILLLAGIVSVRYLRVFRCGYEHPPRVSVYIKHGCCTPLVPVYTFFFWRNIFFSPVSQPRLASHPVSTQTDPGVQYTHECPAPNCSLTTVIGKPLHATPRELLDYVHQRYMEALRDLSDGYSELSKGRQLVFIYIQSHTVRVRGEL